MAVRGTIRPHMRLVYANSTGCAPTKMLLRTARYKQYRKLVSFSKKKEKRFACSRPRVRRKNFWNFFRGNSLCTVCAHLLHLRTMTTILELGLSPTLEAHGVDTIERLDPPRLIKTHYEYAECPKSDKSRYIYVARNPKDCLVRWYRQHRNMKCYVRVFLHL